MLRLLAKLPVRQRTVLVLRHYEGLSEREVAHTLGWSEAAVRSAHSRGLMKLRTSPGLMSTMTTPSPKVPREDASIR